MPRECARFRGHAFLHASIASKTDNMLIKNSVFVGVETRSRHLSRHCNSHSVTHSLAERASRTFDARRFKKLGMSRRLAVQLPEAFDFFHRQVVSAQVQPGIQKHAAVSGRENKVVASNPTRLVRIVF